MNVPSQAVFHPQERLFPSDMHLAQDTFDPSEWDNGTKANKLIGRYGDKVTWDMVLAMREAGLENVTVYIANRRMHF